MMGGRLAFLMASIVVVAACGGATQAPTSTSAAPATTAATAAPTQDPTKAVADFYRGKTVRVVVGLEAGGGFDTTARILARYMGKYIPGEPTLIVENMAGAGSRVAANWLYEAAPKDGTAFGVFNELQVLQQALGQSDIKFDAAKFGWLGSVFSATIVCIARKDSGIKSIQDVMGPNGKKFIVGSTGPGSNTGDFPQILRTALGANIQIVSGYNGTAGISRAVDSNEVQGGCWTWESMSVTQGKNLQDGTMIPLVQQGDEKIKELGNTPVATDIASGDVNKKLILGITTPTSISKSFTAPPGIPAERLKALQDAFIKAWSDKDLLEEAKKAKIDVAPKKAEETKKVVDQLLGFDKATIDALKAALDKK